MRYIYIGGDSFCNFRADEDRHWPLYLAKKLGLELTGSGQPGLHWWATRLELLNYLKSIESDFTEFFIICHTDPNRIFSSRNLQDSPENQKIREIYYKYVHEYDIASWTTEQWYREINRLLAGRKVLHLQGFNSDSFDILDGMRQTGTLLDLSLEEINFNDKEFFNDKRFNHFNEVNNRKLAELLSIALKNYRESSTVNLSNLLESM